MKYFDILTYVAFICLLCMVSIASAAEELKKVTSLQIGIKKRVAPEDCTIKSRKGDSLSMHYTVSLLNK